MPMKNRPDISIVMSVYNNAETLPASLDSILSQEGVELEFIVIDDGSTDASGKILDETAGRDPRLRVVHKENEGLTRALIDGCAMASAPWIARQDADDVSLPGRLAAQLSLSRLHPDAVLISSWGRTVGPEREFLCEVRRPIDPDEAFDQIRDQKIGPPSHGSVMFSKRAYEACGGYRPEFYYAQDSDLWLRIISEGTVVYAQGVFYEYRLSPSAISGVSRDLQSRFGELGQRCHQARKAGESEEPFLQEAERVRLQALTAKKCRIKKKGQWVSFYHIGSLLAERNPHKACMYFRKAIRSNPLALRAYGKLLLNHRLIGQNRGKNLSVKVEALRLLFIVDACDDGGISTYVENLADALHACGRALQIVLWNDTDRGLSEKPKEWWSRLNTVYFRFQGSSCSRDVSEAMGLRNFLNGYTVILSQMFPWVSPWLKKEWVAGRRGWIHYEVAHSTERGFYDLGKMARATASRLVAVSDEIAESLRPLVVGSPVQVSVLRGGIPLADASFSLEQCHRDCEAPIRLCYVGRLENGIKRVYDLVGLCAELEQRGVPFKITVIGDGACRQDLQAKLESMVSGGNLVVFTGRIPHNEVLGQLRTQDILLVFSSTEGWPMVMLEAMLQGTVVVGTCVGGLRANITHRENGFLFDVGDLLGAACIIEELILNSDLREGVRKNARLHVINTSGNLSRAKELMTWIESDRESLRPPRPYVFWPSPLRTLIEMPFVPRVVYHQLRRGNLSAKPMNRQTPRSKKDCVQ